MVRQVDMTFNEMHERCGISSSHWRTLQAKANKDPEVFDYLIEEYKVNIAKKRERLANREAPIPASEYDGHVLSKEEFHLAIYDYIPTALKSIAKKKYYIQNIKALGSTKDLHHDIFVELTVKVRKKSGKTMYEMYLDNVNLWKGYKQLVYRATENLITDRVKKIVREGNMVPLDKYAYENRESEITVGETIISKVEEHEQLYVQDFLERCKQKEIKGVSLYGIAKRLMEDVNENGSDIKLRDICKEYNLNIKKVRAAFEEIETRALLG